MFVQANGSPNGRSGSAPAPIEPDAKVWLVADHANISATAHFHLGGARINWGRILDPIARVSRRHLEIISSSTWMKPRQRDYLQGRWGADVWVAERNADALVGASLLRAAQDADRVILCAGDGDYVPIVDFLRAQGVVVELWFFPVRLSRRLIDACTSVRFFDPSVLFPRPQQHLT